MNRFGQVIQREYVASHQIGCKDSSCCYRKFQKLCTGTFHLPPANKPTFKRKISESIKQSQTQKGIFKKECTYVHQENTGRGVEG